MRAAAASCITIVPAIEREERFGYLHLQSNLCLPFFKEEKRWQEAVYGELMK
jgi:hypothetical protein